MAENGKQILASGDAITCESLLVERGRAERPYSVVLQTHEFWQADIATHGQFEVELDGESHNMLEGDIVIIPPGCAHRFHYPAGVSFLSFKFTILGEECGGAPLLPSHSEMDTMLCSMLDEVVPKTGEPQRAGRGLIGHLLAALIIRHYCKATQDGDVHEGSFADEIKAYVRRQGGRKVTTEEVARFMCYSVRTVSSRFRDEESIGLKQWLDQERARIAEELLMFSDMNATQVAERMGFTDLYTFSRFCRRVLGESPRKIQSRPTSRHW